MYEVYGVKANFSSCSEKKQKEEEEGFPDSTSKGYRKDLSKFGNFVCWKETPKNFGAPLPCENVGKILSKDDFDWQRNNR